MQSEGFNPLNRREMLRLGAAGAGGLLLSGAASSQVLPSSVFAKPAAPIDPLAPAAAAPVSPAAPAGINPILFQKVKAALDSRNWILHRDFIGIADFNQASADPRFHVVHLPSGHVESFRVAHGSQAMFVESSACAEAAKWPTNVKIAVNLSPAQFRSKDLVRIVIGALANSGVSAQRLELEVTETAIMHDSEAVFAALGQLHELGVAIALDDFGTGYSSLSYLQRFPFDKIKIDRSFIKDVAEPDGSACIVQAVVNIAAARHMTTTAEGVETEAQLDALRGLECTEMQGYLFSKPLPAADIRAMLTPGRQRIAGTA